MLVVVFFNLGKINDQKMPIASTCVNCFHALGHFLILCLGRGDIDGWRVAFWQLA